MDNTLVSANYTKISENIRRLTPQGIQCSIFCGGSHCKYENPESWTADSLALQGIYSHWITDDILAMARPSTAVIIKKNIIQQFHSLGIKSIINLQCPKEHASCGEPLEESGFSYHPDLFMENNIYYYNFAWKDYGDATLSELLNMIKVLAFATKEGRVAVHCHAGLGRTGVLIACYLVYSLRVTANDAIKYVRFRRSGSVQTRGQIVCVRHFAQFILPKNVTYFLRDSKDKYMTEFTLQRFLSRQRIVLHGYDERNFKFLPKIIHVICERMLELCACNTDEFASSTTSITSEFFCTKLSDSIDRHESGYSISSITSDNASLSPDSISYANGSFPQSPCQSVENQANTSQLNDTLSVVTTFTEDEIKEDLSEQLLEQNKCFQELQTQKIYQEDFKPKELYSAEEVASALLVDYYSDTKVKQCLVLLQTAVNTSQKGWLQLKSETNLVILAAMLFDWLEGLKCPILGKESLEAIVVHYKQPEICIKKFGMEEGYLIEYLLNFLAKLNPLSSTNVDNILMRIIASLAQQVILINDMILPSGVNPFSKVTQTVCDVKNTQITFSDTKRLRTEISYKNLIFLCKKFRKLRDGTLQCVIECFKSLFIIINNYHSKHFNCDKEEFSSTS